MNLTPSSIPACALLWRATMEACVPWSMWWCEPDGTVGGWNVEALLELHDHLVREMGSP